jgi:hypothetical protein
MVAGRAYCRSLVCVIEKEQMQALRADASSVAAYSYYYVLNGTTCRHVVESGNTSQLSEACLFRANFSPDDLSVALQACRQLCMLLA